MAAGWKGLRVSCARCSRRCSARQGRGWRLFMGAIGVLAGLVVLEYPIDSALTLAFFGGIWLVILGIMQVVAGFQLRAARA